MLYSVAHYDVDTCLPYIALCGLVWPYLALYGIVWSFMTFYGLFSQSLIQIHLVLFNAMFLALKMRLAALTSPNLRDSVNAYFIAHNI